MSTHRAGLIEVVVLSAMVLLVSSRIAAGQASLNGSEAMRAEKCAGDYACDEDGSWSVAYGSPRARLAPSAGMASRPLEEPRRALTDGPHAQTGTLLFAPDRTPQR